MKYWSSKINNDSGLVCIPVPGEYATFSEMFKEFDKNNDAVREKCVL